jgi:uncharacterized membrane protein
MFSGSVLHLKRVGFALLAMLPGPALWAPPAQADLRVCNETGNPIMVSFGYRAERGWQSEGWWEASPSGGCAIVYNGDLEKTYYYLYAVDDIGGGSWDGDNYMCTQDESYTISGVEDCLARGYERTGFFEVNVEGRTDWTVNLTDPNPGAPEALGTDDPGAALEEGPPGADGPGDDLPADDLPLEGAIPPQETVTP